MPSPNTHHYTSFNFTSLAFCLWTSPLFSPISSLLGLPVSQVCRNESWSSVGVLCHWSATRNALNTNCSSLMLDSNSCCCCSSKVRQGPRRTALPLRGYACLTQVYHHFCQLSLSCKQALIFIGASPSLRPVLEHKMTRARGDVLHRAAYDCSAT